MTGAVTGSPLAHIASFEIPALMGPVRTSSPPAVTGRDTFLIEEADEAGRAAYLALRHAIFVEEQGVFSGTDVDPVDADARTVVLVARAPDGTVLGGVRLAPLRDPDIGWWAGSRLVVDRAARRAGGIGASLVRAACSRAEQSGVLRFDADVQPQNEVLFRRLGWELLGAREVAGRPHQHMHWPIDRFERLVGATKSYLGDLLGALAPGGPGFVGDDGAPVPGTDVVAATDAILPSMVERDPWWAGWCAVLVNLNDLAAMGASPVGVLDTLGARDAAHARTVMDGMGAALSAWGVPLLGGHTQLGVPAALGVTALGRTTDPVRGGGGAPGMALSLTADLAGGWRPGYSGAQWDSTSTRDGTELRAMNRLVADAAPSAAKDVSMAGIVGTVGMLAEASGCGARIDVVRVPRPSDVVLGEWLTCFPGFAMVTADPPGQSRMGGPDTATAECGALTASPGIRLAWPDGKTTVAVRGAVTGLETTS